MAYTGPTIVNENDSGLYVVKWTGITNGDDAGMTPIKLEGFDDITGYMFGTVSGSSVLRCYVSPERALPVSETLLYAPAISAGAEITWSVTRTCFLLDSLGVWYKPHLTDGDGSTLLDFYLVCR
jgi:hypothetical protein